MLYFLMLGRFAPAPVPGWYTLDKAMAQFEHYPEPWLASIMTDAIAGWLTEAAAPYGFRPWAVSGSGPRGAGVAKWEHNFLLEHGRCD